MFSDVMKLADRLIAAVEKTADALVKMSDRAVNLAVQDAPPTAAPTKKEKKSSAKEEKPATPPAAETPAAPESPAPETPSTPKPETPSTPKPDIVPVVSEVTADLVRQVATKAMVVCGKSRVAEILNTIGNAPSLSAVKPENLRGVYDALLKELGTANQK